MSRPRRRLVAVLLATTLLVGTLLVEIFGRHPFSMHVGNHSGKRLSGARFEYGGSRAEARLWEPGSEVVFPVRFKPSAPLRLAFEGPGGRSHATEVDVSYIGPFLEPGEDLSVRVTYCGEEGIGFSNSRNYHRTTWDRLDGWVRNFKRLVGL